MPTVTRYAFANYCTICMTIIPRRIDRKQTAIHPKAQPRFETVQVEEIVPTQFSYHAAQPERITQLEVSRSDGLAGLSKRART